MILTMTIGAPGCGKTSYAKELVDQLRSDFTSAAIVSKDDMRNMLSGSTDKQEYWKNMYTMTHGLETAVRNMILMCVSQAFKAGVNQVVIPDCHPTLKSITYTLDMLKSKGIQLTELRVVIFNKNTLEELLAINKLRPETDQLSDELITELHGVMKKNLKEVKKFLKTLNYATIINQPKNPLV